MENLLLLFDQPDHPILHQVGWSRLAKELAKAAYFENNQKKLLNSPEYKNNAQIHDEYQKLKNFNKIIISLEWKNFYQNQIRISPSINFQLLINKIRKQVLFTIPEINEYVLFWEQASFVPESARPNLDVNRLNKFHQNLRKEFRSFVDFTGHADFTLHPVIGPLLKKLSDFERRTSDLLNQLVKQFNGEGVLQYTNFDIIDGRYVLPVRTDRYANSMGRIIHRSDSGSTLHVEFQQIQEHSSQRNAIQEQIEHEVFILEKRYSQVLTEYAPELEVIINFIAEIDFYTAKARWSQSYEGCFPQLTEKFSFEFEEFYHPLIVDPVKNNLKITEDKKVMLISGPNTGGKSILLKTVAINYLLLHCGLPLAASKAKLSDYQNMFYIASDGQDLEKGLSSFAAESERLLNILSSVQGQTIMLVDEIFNSTSSEEASSIAYSVMCYWLKKNFGPAIFTSHHQSLKTWVHENDLMESAHVGFNLEKEIPTYVLHTGAPGSSYATKIFEKFLRKQPKALDLMEVIKSKQQMGFNYENILKKLQDSENEYRELTTKEKEHYARLTAELRAQKLDLDSKKREELDRLKVEIEKIKKKGLNLISSIGNKSHAMSKAFENEFWTITKEVEKLNPIHEKDDETEDLKHRNRPLKIEEGKKYYSAQWRRAVVVVRVMESANIAEVMMGNIKTRVKYDSLFETEIKKEPTFIANIDRSSSTSVILDARGMRLEDFQKEIDKGLSFVISGDLPYFEVIHGHGDGILKTWLRQYLKENREMFNYEIPDMSADGTTKVYLK